ncbi:translation initiation factor IF-3, mitochondrial [Drosophila rhopaloa]|uniref:Translation initiation factor IF-3, mitochondrial n=1 Tax=Drosophila rhopaloa TaxID=1041015 RepID=A0A6P4ET08_DRORH|nr:translation initiation factor IF-3, mitochondrial [Drosophila rhopaloa]
MQRLGFMIRHATAAATHPQNLRPLSIYWNLAQTHKPAGGNGNPGAPRTRDNRSPRTAAQKITLVQQNQSMSITTLEEAQKLAKRRELHLLRLEQTDAKTGRAMFKLVTASEMLSDDAEQSKSSSEKAKEKKSEKSLTIGARITEHDLSSRLKNIAKWLAKRHEVRILIQGNASGSDESSADRIVKAIEQTIKEPQLIGRIVQKRSKGSFIKFSIMPLAPPPVSPANPTAIQS